MTKKKHDGMDYNQARIMEAGKNKLIRPNAVQRQFCASLPYTLLVADFKEFSTKKGRKNIKSRLLAFTDCATGRIVGHFFGLRINSNDAAQCLRGILKDVPLSKTHQIIVHTDRGAEFVSKQFQSVQQEYPLLLFSMSACATPTDNAVAEALWSSLKKLKPLWKQVGCLPMPTFNHEQEGKQVWQKFFTLYNKSHKGERSLKLSGDLIENIIHFHIQSGAKIPKIHFTSNMPWGKIQEEAKQNIKKFKDDAIKSYYEHKECEIVEQSQRKDNQGANNNEDFKLVAQLVVQSHHLLTKKLENQATLAAQQLVSLQQELTKKVEDGNQGLAEQMRKGFEQNKATKHKPVRLRSALETSTVKLIFDRWKHADLFELRTITVIILQRATGCRVNELNPFTLKQLRDLVESRATQIFNTKLSRFEIKVISQSAARQIQFLLKRVLLQLEERFGQAIPENFYIFSSYLTLDATPLHKNYFTQVTNKYLKNIEELINSYPEKPNVHLTSHSSRIGFVTAAFQNHIPVETIMELVGHRDIRATIRYNRNKTSIDQKKELLDSIDSEEAKKEEKGS